MLRLSPFNKISSITNKKNCPIQNHINLSLKKYYKTNINHSLQRFNSHAKIKSNHYNLTLNGKNFHMNKNQNQEDLKNNCYKYKYNTKLNQNFLKRNSWKSNLSFKNLQNNSGRHENNYFVFNFFQNLKKYGSKTFSSLQYRNQSFLSLGIYLILLLSMFYILTQLDRNIQIPSSWNELKPFILPMVRCESESETNGEFHPEFQEDIRDVMEDKTLLLQAIESKMVDPNQIVDSTQNQRILHVEGDVEVVQALLANGADVHAQDNRGGTPLHFAASNDLADIVRILLKYGAQIDQEDREGVTPLDLSFSFRNYLTTGILRKHTLLSNGFDEDTIRNFDSSNEIRELCGVEFDELVEYYCTTELKKPKFLNGNNLNRSHNFNNNDERNHEDAAQEALRQMKHCLMFTFCPDLAEHAIEVCDRKHSHSKDCEDAIYDAESCLASQRIPTDPEELLD